MSFDVYCDFTLAQAVFALFALDWVAQLMGWHSSFGKRM
jgi:hypothetical protein